MTNAEYAHGLRLIADWYEAHPEIEIPEAKFSNYRMNTKEEAARVIRALGSCEKEYGTDDLMSITKMFGKLEHRFIFEREQVCTRRVVGVEEIPEVHIEAHTIPAQIKEIIEWECGPILAPKEKRAA